MLSSLPVRLSVTWWKYRVCWFDASTPIYPLNTLTGFHLLCFHALSKYECRRTHIPLRKWRKETVADVKTWKRTKRETERERQTARDISMAEIVCEAVNKMQGGVRGDVRYLSHILGRFRRHRHLESLWIAYAKSHTCAGAHIHNHLALITLLQSAALFPQWGRRFSNRVRHRSHHWTLEVSRAFTACISISHTYLQPNCLTILISCET